MPTPFARIAITLPPEDLAAADRLAKAQDRSRSWIIAEAVRRYAAEIETGQALDASRAAQLRRDLALTAEERIRAAEDIAIAPPLTDVPPESPRTFATYAEFEQWRRAQSNS